MRKGFLNLHSASDEFEEDFFSVKALTFSTPIPEDEKYPEGFNREDIVKVEDTREVTIPCVNISFFVKKGLFHFSYSSLYIRKVHFFTLHSL